MINQVFSLLKNSFNSNHVRIGHHYYQAQYVHEALDELCQSMRIAELDVDEMTKAEKLLLAILCDAAYLDVKDIMKKLQEEKDNDVGA